MFSRMTVAETGEGGHLLPETVRLLDLILSATTYRDLDGLDSTVLERTASYGARPDTNLPHARFHVSDADPALLAFAGMAEPGFDVLRADCAGFQFHWRNDLARALDEKEPILGRYHAPSDPGSLVVEHFVLPMLVRYRVRRLWGWLTFGGQGVPRDGPMRLSDLAALDRLERPRLVPLSGRAPRGERRGPARIRTPDSATARRDLLP